MGSGEDDALGDDGAAAHEEGVLASVDLRLVKKSQAAVSRKF